MKRWHAIRAMMICLAVSAGFGPPGAAAQAYPNKPLRIIVPFAPGGPNDILARTVGQKLSEGLGQPVIADNRPGGGTVIGTEIAARSPADGYTLLMASTSTAVNPSLKRSLPYDTLKDFAFVSLLAKSPNVLVVHPSVPARSVRQLIALAKARPGQVAYGSGGVGTSTHLTGELLCSMAGVRMIHVPYKGAGPAIIDLMSGQVSWMFATLLPTIPHIRAGKLRAIAIGGRTRSPALPDVPTVAETLPGFESVGWFGVLVPAGTPREIIHRLNGEIDKAVHSKDVREHLLRDGTEPAGGSPQAFAELFRAEMTKWAGVIRSIGIKPN